MEAAVEGGLRNMQVKEVDGVQYEIFCLPPIEALKMQTRLAKIALPVLGSLFGDGSTSEDLPDKELNLQTALAVLADRLDETQFTETVQIFIKKVKKDGVAVNVEMDFTGKPLGLMKLFGACLEVTYGDFFAVLGDKAGFLRGLLNPVKRTSAGPSGESS